MIDFHTHILPALDDGAQNVEMAQKMVEKEREQGVKTLVFTPHYYGIRRSPEQFKQERDAAFEKVKPYLGDMQTVLGAEVYFTAHSAAAPEGIASLAIGKGKYVLLELPFDQRWSRQLFDKIGEFIRVTSCTPIISHVERYGQVLRHPKYLSELLNMGCLLQINAASLQNPRTRALTKAILKHGMAHCIGSDTHNLSDRAPNLKDVQTQFEKDGFLAEFEKAQILMGRILNGETVTVDSTQKIKKCLWNYR